jgi:hypothetical protein
MVSTSTGANIERMRRWRGVATKPLLRLTFADERLA